MFSQGTLFTSSVPSAAQSAERWQLPRELPDLAGVPVLSLDTETNGKNPFKSVPVGVSIAYRTDTLNKMYLPFGHAEGNLDPERVRNWLEWNLTGKEVLFANAKFDIHVLRNWGLDVEELGVKPRDVAFNAALLDDNRRAGLDLDTLGMTYVGEGKSSPPGNMDRIAEMPSWLVAPYAEQDARLTLLIDEASQPLLRREGLGKVLSCENDLIYFVCEIERNGSRIDVETLERWRKEVRAEYEACIMRVHRQVGFIVQPGSGDSLRRLFHQLGIQPPARGKRKGKKLEEEAAPGAKVNYTEVELLTLQHPVMTDVVMARRCESLLSKFLDKFHDALEGGDLLRSQYHQLKSDEFGTIAGRFSSSGGGRDSDGYSFNAQQTIKPDLQLATTGDRWIVRALFNAIPGFQYWACDASQIEYRLFAHFSGAPRIVKAYNDDPKADFHQLVLNMVKTFRPDVTRGTIKNTSFGRLYGAGEDQIAATAGLAKSEAKEFLRLYDRIFPEAKDLANSLQGEARSRGFVSTLLGRRARFGTGEKIHSAVNRVIQGSAADLMKLKLKRVYDERKTLGITQLRMMIHDEQTGDKDPDPKYTKLIQECFNVQEIPLKVPILWELNTGDNWRECK